MEAISEKIKEIRKNRGFSHEYMAHKLNMSQPAYSKIEKNETVLSVDRLFKIAEILETPINEILEISSNTVYNQNNHDGATFIGHQQVQNLYHETNEKFIQSLKDEIQFLREMINKNKN
ncbi:helix-turn-helix domain-containing protein [Flavobacterium sp.]|uniref:helix-turn-helix domain-containing protein n=1 Tax=Flavobacterium sp. TaxID=239 RepID=UPI003753B1C4